MHVAKRVAAGGLLSLMVLVLVAFIANTSAEAANHGQLAVEQPRRDVPVVLDGTVWAHTQIGDRIFVGGDFQQVERPDGSVITQPYIFAYDIDTGVLDENFRPVLNNAVFDLQTNPAGDAVYASGRFWKWDDKFPSRIAKLSADGTLDTTFQGSANAIVRSMAVTNTHVYMAGNFVTVGGQPRQGFAAVDINSGIVDPGFVMNVNNSVNTGEFARGIVATSDGNTVFGLHFGTQINGATREAVAKFDVSGATATLANWSIPWSAQQGAALCLEALRDIAISPDNSYIVIGGQGADRPPNCDSVLRYSTGGTGTINYTWAARMYSSVFSLAVTDVAVYVGGHFCAAPLNPAPPGGITHPPGNGTANVCDVNNPNAGVNPSVIFPNDAVFRSQMAALNPNNGQALSWDPGSNNNLAVFDLTVIDRGILAGHDNNRFNQQLVGRSGFFDFGVPADTTAPTITVDSPASGAILTSLSALEGTAEDDRIVADVTVRLKNLTTNQWLQPNGSSFGPTQADAPVTLTSTGLGTADWTVNLGTTLTPGEYEIRTFAKDQVGQTTSPVLVSPFRIAGAAACSVALDANDNPVISWSDFANVGNVQLRRNGSWLATGAPDSGSHTDTTVTTGSTYSYAVRWNPGGSNVDVPCTPTSITIPAGQNDTTPPNITFTSQTSLSTGVTDLGGGVTDDISGVDRVRVLVRNQQTGQYWNGTSWVSPWSWNLATLNGNTWTLDDVNLNLTGTYSVTLWAWDNDGNRAAPPATPITTITVSGNDTTPPVVTFTTGTNQSTGPVDLNGGVTDAGSGVDRVRVLVRNQQTGQYWNGTSWVSAWSWNAATLDGNTWTLPNVNLSPAGTYKVLLWAWDDANNRANYTVNPQPTITVN